MTPEQIIEMAKQAEISVPLYFNAVAAARLTELQAFAQLVRNAVLGEVNREVSGSPLLSNVAALEVQAILMKMESWPKSQ